MTFRWEEKKTHKDCETRISDLIIKRWDLNSLGVQIKVVWLLSWLRLWTEDVVKPGCFMNCWQPDGQPAEAKPLMGCERMSWGQRRPPWVDPFPTALRSRNVWEGSVDWEILGLLSRVAVEVLGSSSFLMMVWSRFVPSPVSHLQMKAPLSKMLLRARSLILAPCS